MHKNFALKIRQFCIMRRLSIDNVLRKIHIDKALFQSWCAGRFPSPYYQSYLNGIYRGLLEEDNRRRLSNGGDIVALG